MLFIRCQNSLKSENTQTSEVNSNFFQKFVGNIIYIITIATQVFTILLLFTVPVYHVVLFLRYLVLVDRYFSSDICVWFHFKIQTICMAVRRRKIKTQNKNCDKEIKLFFGQKTPAQIRKRKKIHSAETLGLFGACSCWAQIIAIFRGSTFFSELELDYHQY